MEFLPDPLNDRVIKEVKAPPHKPLATEFLYEKNGLPNYDLLLEHLSKEGKIGKKDFLDLVAKATIILKEEPNMVKVTDPVIVVGDLHGQFYDLISLLKFGGHPSTSRYLFLGDYVDRGAFSVEIIILLYAMKIAYPTNVWLLRGNHECRHLTSYFNFKTECEIKYDLEIYNSIMNSFDCLPLASLINDKFLCVHGGISPNLELITSIDKINRLIETPKNGIMCDLLWSDPIDLDTEAPSVGFRDNSTRGCSFHFGLKAIKPFLVKNKLISLFRAHEAQLEGFKMHKWENLLSFPPVITIFSAPNYCDVYNNKSAVIILKDNNINFQQFNYNSHPYILPGFQNIFNWSIPFISEKISEMLYHIVKGKIDELAQDNTELIDETLTESLRLKVKFVTLMMRMFKTLREEKELILKLKGCCPGNKIPRGLIIQGPNALKNAFDRYYKAKVYDVINEKLPDVDTSHSSKEYLDDI